MKREFCGVEQAIYAMAAGQVLIVADSEDRENEGDFLAPAQYIDAATIHFMTSVGRGQLCVPVTCDMMDRLQLAPMVADNYNTSVPQFVVPIDHRTCGTGISPLERAQTIQAMLDPASTAADFIRPGHVFPLAARPGGLMQRIGHTEATVDLARLAGLTPAGVLCEICSRDGRNMALRDELFEIAEQYNLLIVTIDALLEFRRQELRQESAILDAIADLRREVTITNQPALAGVPASQCRGSDTCS